MPRNLVEVLRENGPMSSSELILILTQDGTSSDAARQQISRSRDSVKRLAGVRLPNRQTFLYLEEQSDTVEFYDSLSRVLLDSGSAYGSFIRGLLSRKGMIRKEYGSIASGLPIQPTKGQVLHTAVLDQLKAIRMVIEVETPSGTFLELRTGESSVRHCLAAELVENIILAAVKDWLVRLNFGSMNSLHTRSSSNGLPQCGQFSFDFVGPSYVSALRRGEHNHGFIVGDVLIGRQLNISDIRPFLRKIDSLFGQRRAKAIQGFLVADGYEEDALMALRSRGVILAGPTSVFGPELGKDIRSLIGVLENAAAVVATDPTELFSLLSRLQKIEGVALNLRGIVLELVVAHLYMKEGYLIDIRQQINGKDGLAEIDVKANNNIEVVCCECKGMSPGNLVGEAELTEWLDRPLKRIKEWMKESNSLPETKRFEFYSSTGYTEEALALINRLKTEHKKQPLVFYDGKEIIAKLKAKRARKLAELFKEQFGF